MRTDGHGRQRSQPTRRDAAFAAADGANFTSCRSVIADLRARGVQLTRLPRHHVQDGSRPGVLLRQMYMPRCRPQRGSGLLERAAFGPEALARDIFVHGRGGLVNQAALNLDLVPLISFVFLSPRPRCWPSNSCPGRATRWRATTRRDRLRQRRMIFGRCARAAGACTSPRAFCMAISAHRVRRERHQRRSARTAGRVGGVPGPP